MDLTRTAYLCSGKRIAIDVVGADKRKMSITTETKGNTVTASVPMAPVGSKNDTSVDVIVGMLRAGKTWADKYPHELRGRLASDDLSEPFWINGVTLDMEIPPGCDWIASQLACSLADAPFAEVRPVIAPGIIPDNKADVPQVKVWKRTIVSTAPIPGDRIDARHLYRVAQPVTVGPVWFRTEVCVGGRIVARRAHPAIPNLLSYDVATEDQVVTDVLPTDYFLFDVGDDVFLFVVGDTRSSLEPSFPSGSFRLLPVRLGGRGPGGLSYLNFTEYANLRVLVGSVSAVSDTYNEADVYVNGSTYTLPIVYHCVDQSTGNGRQAFRAGDSVLVLWSGYRSSLSSSDMVVVGHVGYVYPCTTTTTTTTTTTSTTTTGATTAPTTSSTSTTTTSGTTSTTTTQYVPDVDGWVLIDTSETSLNLEYYDYFVWFYNEGTATWNHNTWRKNDHYFAGQHNPWGEISKPGYSEWIPVVSEDAGGQALTYGNIKATIIVWTGAHSFTRYDFLAVGTPATVSLGDTPVEPPVYGAGMYDRIRTTWSINCRVEHYQYKHLSGPNTCGLPS